MFGYNGKFLFVNLSTREITTETFDEQFVREYIGGYGFGAKVLHDKMPAGADPLGEESILGFISGISNGTGAMFGGRFTMVHKSPVTGGWNDSNSGGFFGPELKKAGYDALFISGIADSPVYIWINDGEVKIEDAAQVWGQDTKEVWETLKEKHQEPAAKIVAIGPSGERKSLMACPINDGHRAPGRGGGGAVMGSKNLKAILVRGTGKIPVAHPERLKEINRTVLATMKKNKGAKSFGDHGTGAGTPASALSGDSPVKNWKGVGIIDYGEDSAKALGAREMDRYKTKKYACSSCPLGCGAEYKVEDGRWPVGTTDRPEYETASAFGSTLLCDEMDVIIKVNDICNRYGLDTISTGMTVAWAMECYDEKLLSIDDLDGIDLKWGNGEAIVAMVEKIAHGEGCGRILSNGSAFAADHYGKGHEYLQTASGIELPMHDSRFAPGLARTYQFDPTPGRHVKGGLGNIQMGGNETQYKYDYKGTGKEDVELTSKREIMNVAGFCMFSRFGTPPEGMVDDYVEAIGGFDFDADESFKAGLRIYALRHAFNLREGILPKNMTITRRALGKPPLEAGPLEGIEIDGDLLARNFFEELGWDFETGIPSEDFFKMAGGLDWLEKKLQEGENSDADPQIRQEQIPYSGGGATKLKGEDRSRNWRRWTGGVSGRTHCKTWSGKSHNNRCGCI